MVKGKNENPHFTTKNENIQEICMIYFKILGIKYL